MNGKQPMPGVIMPGQHVRVTEGGKGELGIFIDWLRNLFLLRLLTVLSVLWQVWICGPYLVGSIILLYALAKFYRRIWPCFVVVICGVAFFAVGAEALWNVWFAPFGLRPDELRPFWLWLILALPSPVWWSVWRYGDFRNRNEMTDKYSPGPIKAREPGGGAVGPDNPLGVQENEIPVSPSRPPAREPLVIVTEMRDNGKLRSRQRHEMSRRLEDKMPAIARLTVGVESPFSEPEMAGPGKPLSSKTYKPIRDELLSLGALVWRDPARPTLGVQWTPLGFDLCKRFNGHPPTPPQ